jgi:hypothetical protein
MGLAAGVTTQLVNSVVAAQKQLRAGNDICPSLAALESQVASFALDSSIDGSGPSLAASSACWFTRTGEPLRRLPADLPGMESLVVECLHCRTSRVARRDRFKHFESPECPECGYLGWAPVLEVTEAESRQPRKQARAERRLPSIA